jgi:hypothetical protein
VVDISDEEHPSLLATLDLGVLTPVDLYLDPPFAYIADSRGGGLRIVDVRDPGSPVLIGNMESPGGRTNDVVVHGNYAYLADHEAGVQVVNVADPSAPTLMGGIEFFVIATGVATDGENVFVCGYDYTGGGDQGRLRVAPIQCAGILDVPEEDGRLKPAFRLLPATPNPTRLGTTVRFTLEVDGNVQLVVFDVIGRQVRRVLAGWINRGPHEILWNGRDDQGIRVGGGVYFMRLKTESGSDSRSVVILD